MEAPGEITRFIHAAQPFGAGFFTRLGVKIFEASLWTDAAAWSMDAPFALSITYHRSFAAHDLVERTLAEMRRQEPLTAEQRGKYATELARVFPTVRKGERITALHVPRTGTTFFHNGVETGVLTEAVLSARFFDIWLGQKSSEQRLRSDLLTLSS